MITTGNIIIDLIIVGVVGFFLGLVLPLLFPLRKKYDLHTLKKLTYESGEHLMEAWKRIKELEKTFKEIENAKN